MSSRSLLHKAHTPRTVIGKPGLDGCLNGTPGLGGSLGRLRGLFQGGRIGIVAMPLVSGIRLSRSFQESSSLHGKSEPHLGVVEKSSDVIVPINAIYSKLSIHCGISQEHLDMR